MKYTESPIDQDTVYTANIYGSIIENRINICSHPSVKDSVNLEKHKKITNINFT